MTVVIRYKNTEGWQEKHISCVYKITLKNLGFPPSRSLKFFPPNDPYAGEEDLQSRKAVLKIITGPSREDYLQGTICPQLGSAEEELEIYGTVFVFYFYEYPQLFMHDDMCVIYVDWDRYMNGDVLVSDNGVLSKDYK